MWINKLALQSVIFLTCCLIAEAQQSNDALSSIEKEALARFRSKIGEDVYQDYLDKGFTIIHFLRARNFNLENADKMLRDAVQWRKENKIDNILNENLLPELYPYTFEGVDKKGRPVGYLSPPRWDVRKVIVSGKRDQLLRYLYQFHERAHKQILDARNSTGKHITRFPLIVDVAGYNLRQHACFGCFPLYFAWLDAYEQFYPGDMSHIIFVNVPRIAHPFLELLKPLMSPSTRKSFHVFASNKQEWTAELTKTIDKSQLLPKFGGTKS